MSTSRAAMSAWPSADWDDWPGTRIGGLAVFGGFVLAVILICVIPVARHCCCRIHRTPMWLLTLQAVGVGCIVGLAVHFVPCIWWTCDWGPNDGEGVRGAIWFIVWAITAVGICCRAQYSSEEAAKSHEMP